MTGNTASTTTHDVTAPGARYVRLAVTAPTSTSDTAARIYELEVYGSAASGAGSIIGIGGKCLDVNNAGTADGTKVQLWTCNGTGSQVWQPQSDGSIRNPQSGKVLQAAGGGTADGTQIQIGTYTGGAHQKWVITAG